MVNCAVINCKNCTNGRRKNQENVSFHRFPHEPNLKRKWIEATGNKDWSPTKHSTICSKHFEEASFVEGKKQRILANAAYPTVDVLKITTEENIDPKVKPETTSLSPKKRKLEKDEVSGGSKSKEKEKEIKLFCPKCKTEVSHTAEGIQADQTKIIVAKVYNYLEQEYEELKKTFEGIDQTPLSKIRQRTALATGVSETMVEEILQEEARRHEELHQETLLEESRARKRPRQTESLMEEGSSDENEADDEDKNEDEDIADDDDQIETLVIKEEPIEPYNEEPEAYVELPAVKQEPGEFGDNQDVAQPVSLCLKTEPQDEEEATASTETTAVQLASKSKKRRATKRNTDVPPAATISPATSVLPGTSTPGSSAIPGTSAPPERRLILLEDGEVKMEQIEIGEEGFS